MDNKLHVDINIQKGVENCGNDKNLYINILNTFSNNDVQEKEIKTVLKGLDQLHDKYVRESYVSIIQGVENVMNNAGIMQFNPVFTEIKSLIDKHYADIDELKSLLKQLLSETIDLKYGIRNNFDKKICEINEIQCDEASYEKDIMEITQNISRNLIKRYNKSLHEDKETLLVVVDKINKGLFSLLKDDFNVFYVNQKEELCKIMENEPVNLLLVDVDIEEEAEKMIEYSISCYPHIPVIVMSETISEESIAKWSGKGALDFIDKPFNEKLLAGRIRHNIGINHLQIHLLEELNKQKAALYNKRIHMDYLSDQMIQAFIKVIETKDEYTQGHSNRVASYTEMIARRLGYSEQEIIVARYTGLLHDIGKIAVPSVLITKPGRLTSAEYDIMKAHPITGGEILGHINEIPSLRLGALYHHERYDGEGFPLGLKGESIPEIARIIACADAYDAMTSKRSYRDIMPQNVVREEFFANKGTQFDPYMADIVIQLINEDENYTLHG